MTRFTRLSFVIALLIGSSASARAQQFADPEFDANVDRPAFTDRHPSVLVDEAHQNFHTAGGRYKPFADLLTNDGYSVTPNKQKFTAESLKDCTVLIVVNAQGAPQMRSPEAAKPAFEAAECDAVRDWIRAGGSLLLIADHHPWGASSEQLAAKLGVEMGKSTTFDPVNSETGALAQLNFSRANHLIGKHPILLGRDGSERIDRVLTFAGQSLKGPPGSVNLLPLSSSAADQPGPALPGRSGSAAGRAQGLAFTLGKGNVVVLGEAAMLTAQVNGRQRIRMGMNVPGTDNRQFALNVMHWLSRVKLSAEPDAIAAKPKSKPAITTGKGTTAAPAPANQPAEAANSVAMPAAAREPTPRAEPGRILSSAEIAAESEPSIAMITGDGSVGTGFLVRPGIVATNAHVIDDEFLSSVRVRFPSAEKPLQGPITAELLYEDTRRDLAFLRVKSSLPPLRIASIYKFRKGEDVTAIGNPGAGGELILENAISRGLMSTKTSLDGQKYYQLGISVNPGNSGGPVFNSSGAVIGVVTRKSAQQEALAFCIPVEELNLAIDKVVTFPQDAIDRQQSHHRLILTVKGLGSGGALYSTAITFARNRARTKADSKASIGYFDAAIAHLEKQTFPRVKAEMTQVRDDPHVSAPVREKIVKLADNLEKLKALYTAKAPTKGSDPLPKLRETHLRLLTELCKPLDLDIPPNIIFTFDDSSENQKPGDSPKKPESPDQSPAKPDSPPKK